MGEELSAAERGVPVERERLVLSSATAPSDADGHEEERPWATLVLLLGYLAVLAILWGAIYVMLLSRA